MEGGYCVHRMMVLKPQPIGAGGAVSTTSTSHFSDRSFKTQSGDCDFANITALSSCQRQDQKPGLLTADVVKPRGVQLAV